MTVPVGVIAIWTGALLDVPANWDVCDGTNGTPDLVDKFLRGAPDGQNPGSTGGNDSHDHTIENAADHQHTLQTSSHGHSTTSDGGHSHGGTSHQTGSGVYSVLTDASVGDHSHSTSTNYHSHSSGSNGGHTHTAGSSNSIPPSYTVAYIRANTATAVQTGIIVIWSRPIGDVPSGWAVCDGDGGRPNLNGRFTQGSDSPGDITGSENHSHTTNSTGAHTHTSASVSNHSHTLSSGGGHSHHDGRETSHWDTVFCLQGTDDGSHTHSSSGSGGAHDHGSLGSDGSHDHDVDNKSNYPPFKKAVFIIATEQVSPATYSIFAWAGLLTEIPSGYALCDGGEGRPDYRECFILGTTVDEERGDTGGNATHNHEGSSEGHSGHSVTSESSHSHGPAGWSGTHDHSPVSRDIEGHSGSLQFYTSFNSDGNHYHSLNDSGWHIHYLTTASHTHTWQNASTLPSYYEVAFIQAMPEDLAVSPLDAINITQEEARVRGVIDSHGAHPGEVEGRFRYRRVVE